MTFIYKPPSIPRICVEKQGGGATSRIPPELYKLIAQRFELQTYTYKCNPSNSPNHGSDFRRKYTPIEKSSNSS